MKKIILPAIVVMIITAGAIQAQDRFYYTPVINKQLQKHEPRVQNGIFANGLKSDESRLRKEYQEVRKAELRAKAESKALNRERNKQKRKEDKNSWASYKKTHDRFGRPRV